MRRAKLELQPSAGESSCHKMVQGQRPGEVTRHQHRVEAIDEAADALQMRTIDTADAADRQPTVWTEMGYRPANSCNSSVACGLARKFSGWISSHPTDERVVTASSMCGNLRPTPPRAGMR